MTTTLPVTTSAVIACENLHKSYGSLEVLKGVSTMFTQGDVVSVIGPSGCGKSTFLRCLNRLESINQGRLEVMGEDMSAPKLPWKSLFHLRSHVSMVFQHFNLFPHLTVLENLMLSPRKVLKCGEADCRNLALHYLDKVGLGDKADAYPEQLSGGQKQRVMIAIHALYHAKNASEGAVDPFGQPVLAEPGVVRQVGNGRSLPPPQPKGSLSIICPIPGPLLWQTFLPQPAFALADGVTPRKRGICRPAGSS
ncbi:MAG: amino acid ABC transporter ATP-binding protein, partial [Leptolyngbyaceae cyanobacterium SM2_3_12]|nr:amino acid ABC transporter ATP-binding protein [Leptolyngbyaceae cyanobacterium SM2_3_12]